MRSHKTALGHLAKELEDNLQLANDQQRRLVALRVCELAVSSLGVEDPRLQHALEMLRAQRFGESAELESLRNLVEELDEIGWNLQEEVEAGMRPYEDYAAAFTRARAAEAVAEAFDADSFLAAANSVYEAHAATENLEAIRAILVGVLRLDEPDRPTNI